MAGGPDNDENRDNLKKIQDPVEESGDEDITDEEYKILDSQLDQLNSALNVLEQKNDDIHEQLKQLLQSNIDIRQQIQADIKTKTVTSEKQE